MNRLPLSDGLPSSPRPCPAGTVVQEIVRVSGAREPSLGSGAGFYTLTLPDGLMRESTSTANRTRLPGRTCPRDLPLPGKEHGQGFLNRRPKSAWCTSPWRAVQGTSCEPCLGIMNTPDESSGACFLVLSGPALTRAR